MGTVVLCFGLVLLCSNDCKLSLHLTAEAAALVAQRHAACKQEEEACFQQSISNHYEDYEETFTKTFWAASVYHRVLGSTLFILCEVSHRMTID